MGGKIERFIKMYDSENAKKRLSALESLKQYIDREDVAELFLRALDDEDEKVKAEALETLDFGTSEGSIPARDAVYKGLINRDWKVRLQLINIINKTLRPNKNEKKITDALRNALNDDHEEVRKRAAECITTQSVFGMKSINNEKTIRALFKTATDQSLYVRGAVNIALYSIARKETFPLFLKALTDKQPQVRQLAVGGITKLCMEHPELEKEVQSSIVKLFKDKDPEVRALVARAACSFMDTKKVFKFTKSDDFFEKETAAQVLAYQGDKRAVPMLIDAIKNKRANIIADVNGLYVISKGKTIQKKELAVTKLLQQEVETGTGEETKTQFKKALTELKRIVDDLKQIQGIAEHIIEDAEDIKRSLR
jgi:HEAT repeat protein